LACDIFETKSPYKKSETGKISSTLAQKALSIVKINAYNKFNLMNFENSIDTSLSDILQFPETM
jgi:hypothetical protein